MHAQTLLETRGTASASESKSVRLHAFDVPEGVAALAFRFDFRPRTCNDPKVNAELIERAIAQHAATRADRAAREQNAAQGRQEVQPLYRELNNLLNAVLIDPDGRWRGRWDRNPSSDGEALLLAEGQSSKGFLPGRISPGRWTVAVELHGVFGPKVSYDVRVEARGPLSEAERAALGAPAGEGQRVRRQRRGSGWYFGEMHSHTVHSDGRHELFELASRGAALGIDFICLTDHNTTSGLLDLEDLPLTIVPGCELTTFRGHHPVYGLHDMLPWHEGGAVLSLHQMAPRLRAMGALISVAHPYRIGDPICTGCRMPDGLDSCDFDLFEVWYRKWNAAEIDNQAAYALWNRFWEQGRRVTAVAARDWHGPAQEGPFPGPMAFTGVRARDDSADGIVDGLRRGEVILSGGPIADLSLVADDERAAIGGTLRAEAATLRVELAQMDGPAELRLFRSGTEIRRLRIEGDGAHELEVDRPGWYRAEVWREDLPRVITNHAVLTAR